MTDRPTEYSSYASPAFNYEAFPPLGIDLGTSNSSIARWVNVHSRKGAEPYTLGLLGTGKLMKSAVYSQQGEGGDDVVVGRVAYQNRLIHPERVALAFKRMLGDQAWADRLGEQHFTAVDLTTKVVEALLSECKSQGLVRPAGIVATVPYHFKQHQNHDTRQAIQQGISGIFENLPEHERPRLLELIPEPVAAALDYAYSLRRHSVDQKVLVFDFGGGTIDLMLLDLQISGKGVTFEVKGTAGIDRLGGEDFDEVLEQHVLEEERICLDSLRANFREKDRAQIRQSTVDTKEALSSSRRVGLQVVLSDGRVVDREVDRLTFESLLSGGACASRDFGAEVGELLDRCLDTAGWSADAVTTILPVGGSTKIPFFRRLLAARLGRARIVDSGDPEEPLYRVARGAALYAAFLLDRESTSHHKHLDASSSFEVFTRTAHDLGVRTYDGSFSVVVPANTRLSPGAPARVRKVYNPVPGPEPNRVYLPQLPLFQRSNGSETSIGCIPDIPPAFIHGRIHNEVDIALTFEVTHTQVMVEIVLPGCDSGGEDVRVRHTVHLESRA